jgi:hypothetical protein
MLQMWLRPGDTRSGWVTYEVPEDVAAAQFRFTGFREPGADIGLWDLTTGAPLASTPVLTPAEAGFDVAVTVKAPQTDLTARLIGYIEPAPSAQFLTPPPGYHLAAVEMEITNSGAGPYDERAWFSTALIDASGQEYNASIPSSNPLGPPFPDSLPAGASARGIHYFFVLDGASIVKLQFSPKFDTWLDWVEFAIV